MHESNSTVTGRTADAHRSKKLLVPATKVTSTNAQVAVSHASVPRTPPPHCQCRHSSLSGIQGEGGVIAHSQWVSPNEASIVPELEGPLRSQKNTNDTAHLNILTSSKCAAVTHRDGPCAHPGGAQASRGGVAVAAATSSVTPAPSWHPRLSNPKEDHALTFVPWWATPKPQYLEPEATTTSHSESVAVASVEPPLTG